MGTTLQRALHERRGLRRVNAQGGLRQNTHERPAACPQSLRGVTAACTHGHGLDSQLWLLESVLPAVMKFSDVERTPGKVSAAGRTAFPLFHSKKNSLWVKTLQNWLLFLWKTKFRSGL